MRLFSVAHFYHFAFTLISLALLGFGVGGTLLASAPTLVKRLAQPRPLAALCLSFAVAAPASYLVVDYIPFDSFQIAWDARQLGLLALNFGALAVPFTATGLAVGALIAAQPARSNRLYAANLAGSAAGAGLALGVPVWFGGEGVVLGAAWLGALAGMAILEFGLRITATPPSLTVAALRIPHLMVLILASFWLLRPPPWLSLQLSPFKPLARMQAAPDAALTISAWSGAARVDVLESATVRALPGLSFAYQGATPAQAALFTDGDAPAPISNVDLSDPESVAFAYSLSQSIGYVLRPGARALVIEPGGGLDVVAALAASGGAQHVTATFREPLAPDLLQGPYATFSGGLLDDARVSVVREDGRAFLQRTHDRFDVIVLALTDPNRPVTAGAYSLLENYTLTVEGVQAALRSLAPGGVLVVSRWLQSPPSEELRTYALLLAALDSGAAERQIVGLRGFQHATFLLQPAGFSEADWAAVRAFASDQRFDLIAGPGLSAAEVNRYAVLPEPVYFETLRTLRDAPNRDAFFGAYEFDVRPPTDDHPYFFHFFKWRQTPEVLAALGQAWLPFGGSGYLMLALLLLFALALASVLVAIPLLRLGPGETTVRYRGVTAETQLQQSAMPARREGAYLEAIKGLRVLCVSAVKYLSVHLRRHALVGGQRRSAAGMCAGWGALRTVVYFGGLGLGFLLVEVPLAQRYILFLGRPAYALAVVIAGVLAFSGLGSMTARRWDMRWALGFGVMLIVLYPAALSILFQFGLGLSLPVRSALAFASLGPLGFMLGVPFAAGLAALEGAAPQRIPWAWAINGSASVVSAVLAPLLSLSFGFRIVLWVGAAAYCGALSVALVNGTKRTARMR